MMHLNYRNCIPENKRYTFVYSALGWMIDSAATALAATTHRNEDLVR